MFLPPYSPDYNPIENAFSKIKSYLRRNGSLYTTAVVHMRSKVHAQIELHKAVWSVTATDAAGWFRHCSYM